METETNAWKSEGDGTMKTYYYTTGDVRGECGHQHRTAAGAQKCIDRDQSGCASQGGYSDRVIRLHREDGSEELVVEGTCGGWYTVSEMEAMDAEEYEEQRQNRRMALSE